MPRNPVRLWLPTGDPILLRPVAPDDRDRVRDALEWTSRRTRTARFGRNRSALTDAELDYFTRVDQLDHVAWCAVAGWLPGEPGIGSARFARDAKRPDTAEMAVIVVDEYQGMGVGTALMEILYTIALERGIRSLVGYVLAENQAVVQWLRQLGAQVAWKDVIYEARLTVSPGGPDALETPTADRFRGLLLDLERGELTARVTRNAAP